jgi:hypothetical protein
MGRLKTTCVSLAEEGMASVRAPVSVLVSTTWGLAAASAVPVRVTGPEARALVLIVERVGLASGGR